MAILLALLFLVPFGLERSFAVVPTTSTGPAPPTPGPQTWVLSSTIAIPGPTTLGAEAERDPEGARSTGEVGDRDGNDSASMIIRVPVASPTSAPGTAALTATQHSASPSSTGALPSTTVPATASTCPKATATGIAPRLAEKLGGKFGSTSGTGGDCAGRPAAG